MILLKRYAMNKKYRRQVFKQAIYGLKINVVRTALTILGLVIGIASVIIVLSAGNSVQAFILGELAVLVLIMLLLRSRCPMPHTPRQITRSVRRRE